MSIELPLIQSKCPATFCPLFAAQGSPWTGAIDAPCKRSACGFWDKNHCIGQELATESIVEEADGMIIRAMPDCKFAAVCQWQIEAGEKPCAPRYAVMIGVNPIHAGW